MRSRPDSGIAVSTSSASYASSEHHKDTIDDIDEPCLTTSCQEMVEKVKQVREVNLSLFILRFCWIESKILMKLQDNYYRIKLRIFFQPI